MPQKPSRRFDKGARVWGCYFGSPRHQTTSPSLVHFFVDFCCQVLSIAVDIEDTEITRHSPIPSLSEKYRWEWKQIPDMGVPIGSFYMHLLNI